MEEYSHTPELILYLMMHKEYISIYEQVGGQKNFESIVCNIYYSNTEGLDTNLCDLYEFSRIIALILASGYRSTNHFERFYNTPPTMPGVPSLYNLLSLIKSKLDHYIDIRGINTENLYVPILAAIADDVFLNNVSALEKLLILLGKRDIQIHSPYFCFPASQYIAIWKNGMVEVWACDPDLNGLASNLIKLRTMFHETGRAEKLPMPEPI